MSDIIEAKAEPVQNTDPQPGELDLWAHVEWHVYTDAQTGLRIGIWVLHQDISEYAAKLDAGRSKHGCGHVVHIVGAKQ